VLIADKFERSGLDGLKALGCDIEWQPDLKGDALVEAIKTSQAEVLVVRSTKVEAPMLDAGRLTLVVRAGAGFDNIDVAGASARGIYVANCPGKNSVAVAELAFGLILALDRRIPDNVAELRAGRWNKKEFSQAAGLYGKTLGVLGFGNIGQEMTRRAQAFGMHVAIWSEIGVETDRSGLPIDMPLLVRLRPSSGHLMDPFAEVCQTPEEVAEKSDILSVHLALNNLTRNRVNADVFNRLKPGAFFVNTARAAVVDYDALAVAVKERDLRVALDVFAKEPATSTGEFHDTLLSLPNVYGTHHIGASTDQAQEAIATEVVRIVKAYLDSGRVANVVNLARQTPATHVLVVRHRDQPGVLATVFDALRDGNVNVQETENLVFSNAQTAIARINVDGEPPGDLVAHMLATNADILDVQVVPLNVKSPSVGLVDR
jgi:D-3-phosphoglycerate dehydrogenase